MNRASIKSAVTGFVRVCKWHLIYLAGLVFGAIAMPTDDVALLSSGTMLMFRGLHLWGLLQVIYLLPLLLKARKDGRPRLLGMLAAALFPILLSSQLLF